MTTVTNKNTRTQQREKIGQFRLLKVIWMFAWPALWYTLLIYSGKNVLFADRNTIPTWFQLLVISLGGGAELIAGLFLLKQEGYKLTFASLKERLRLCFPRGWKTWTLVVMVLLLGLSLSMIMGPVHQRLATLPGFVPPMWWPAASNPRIDINGAADVFPDVDLTGNLLFVILYFGIGLIFNVLGEEIYYRGYLLPYMHGVFGKGAWIANGVLFTLKHVYQRWLYPGILVGGLCFAFGAGPLGSLPVAIAYHWTGNYLFQMLFLIQAVFTGG